MLDYHNLFECSCGKLLPFGTKRCPFCGYDYTNIERSEWKLFLEKIYIVFCFIFPIIASNFPQGTIDCIGRLSTIVVPILLYFSVVWYYDSKEYHKYRNIILNIKQQNTSNK